MKSGSIFWAHAALCLLLLSCSSPGSRAPSDEHASEAMTLRLFAAASLNAPITELAALYSQEHPGTKIELNLASSLFLRRQIEAGAAVDVFLSASPEHVERLRQAELLQADPSVDLLTNRMVIIAPAGSRLPLPGAQEHDAPGSIVNFFRNTLPHIRRIALSEKGTPAGDYATASLEKLGIWPQVESKIVLLLDEPAVVVAVARQAAEMGIVYRSSTMGPGSNDGIRIVEALPPESHPRVIYQAAICRSAEHPEAARQLLLFLQQEETMRIFQKHGFEPLKRKS